MATAPICIAAQFRRANPAPTVLVSASCPLIPIYNKTTSSASSPGRDPSCHPERSRRISNYLTLHPILNHIHIRPPSVPISHCPVTLLAPPREAEPFTRFLILM